MSRNRKGKNRTENGSFVSNSCPSIVSRSLRRSWQSRPWFCVEHAPILPPCLRHMQWLPLKRPIAVKTPCCGKRRVPSSSTAHGMRMPPILRTPSNGARRTGFSIFFAVSPPPLPAIPHEIIAPSPFAARMALCRWRIPCWPYHYFAVGKRNPIRKHRFL